MGQLTRTRRFTEDRQNEQLKESFFLYLYFLKSCSYQKNTSLTFTPSFVVVKSVATEPTIIGTRKAQDEQGGLFVCF